MPTTPYSRVYRIYRVFQHGIISSRTNLPNVPCLEHTRRWSCRLIITVNDGVI